MEYFKKNMCQRGKTKWVETVTKEDINSIPIILVGLNYHKFFPLFVQNVHFSKAFEKQNPDLVFFTSQFSNKTMASQVKKANSHVDLVNRVHYHEYKEEDDDFIHPPVAISPLDKPEQTISHHLQGTDLYNLSKVEQVFPNDQRIVL